MLDIITEIKIAILDDNGNRENPGLVSDMRDVCTPGLAWFNIFGNKAQLIQSTTAHIEEKIPTETAAG